MNDAEDKDPGASSEDAISPTILAAASQTPEIHPPAEGDGPLALIKDLTTHIEILTKGHLALFKKEVRADVKLAVKSAAMAAVAGVVALMGYVFLMMTLVVCAGAFGGAQIAAYVAIGITAVHLVVAGAVFVKVRSQLAAHPMGPEQLESELKRDKQWMNQLTAQ